MNIVAQIEWGLYDVQLQVEYEFARRRFMLNKNRPWISDGNQPDYEVPHDR